MKKTIIISLLAATAFVCGCDNKDEAKKDETAEKDKKKDKDKDKKGGDLIKECKDLQDALDKCDNMPDEGKKAYQDTLASAQKALKEAKGPAKEAAENAWKTSCKTSADALKAACK